MHSGYVELLAPSRQIPAVSDGRDFGWLLMTHTPSHHQVLETCLAQPDPDHNRITWEAASAFGWLGSRFTQELPLPSPPYFLPHLT